MGFRELANENAQYIVLAMNEQLNKKISFAISIIQSAAEQAGKAGQSLEICYSGGKDSDVILELAKMALRGGQYRAIYKNTTIDPPGTIKHCKEKGVEILQPKMTFRELIEKRGSPSRFRRHCCEVLKEYKVLDYAVVGIRRSESVKRAQRYKEPEICRVYNSKEKVRQYLPILEWTDKDVEDFILIRGIKCHPLYYDEMGNFHVERRLGCIGCPLQSQKQRRGEFLRFPKMLRLYVHAQQKFVDTHPNCKSREYFKDASETFVYELYCNNMVEFREKFKDNLFDSGIDCKTYLENQFGVKL